MKRFIFSAIVTLFILNGFLSSSLCSADYPGSWGYYNRPVQNFQTKQATPANAAYYSYPPRWRPMTPTEMQTGYTIEQILSMPITERPDRPGHFIGNAIRWQYRMYKNSYKE